MRVMEDIKNLLIIQARTGSSRLPDKVMKELCGKPILQHVIERCIRASYIDKVIVATTIEKNDDKIENLCKSLKINCFRGSENDVLDRYYQAAISYHPVNIIRVTSDCPIIDHKIIDKIIEIHINGQYDYTSNTLEETYPDGLDTEVFTMKALEEAWEKADLASEREHVTPYIKFKGNYIRKSVTRTPSLKEKRWTVDTVADYEFMLRIYDALYEENADFGMKDVLDYIQKYPELEKINSGIIRNEGYIKSINNDKVVR